MPGYESPRCRCRHYQEVRVAEGCQTARGAILIFLLLQINTASADAAERIGVSGPWTEYVKFLPETIPLPTFWSEAEQELLAGTSLQAALQAKLKNLTRELNHLRTATKSISWCQRLWWDEDTENLTIYLWKLVDAMYRSRALDLPGTGHVMVPCIDMANHASGEDTVALYETDVDGNGVLLLREGKSLTEGEEVTITYVVQQGREFRLRAPSYGDEKGACEMVFSYGFLEHHMETSRELFLDLDIPDDDPLKFAKKAVSKSAPGFRLFSIEGGTSWEGDFIWLICVNEEDGLDFQVTQSNDGRKELEVHWKDVVLSDIGRLKDMLTRDPMWEVFQLRAIAILQDRVQLQLSLLNATEEQVQSARGAADVSLNTWETITRLRELEWALLSRANQHFEQVVRPTLLLPPILVA